MKTPYWEYDDTVSDTDDISADIPSGEGKTQNRFAESGDIYAVRRRLSEQNDSEKEQCLFAEYISESDEGNRILQNLGTQRSLRKTMSGRLTGQVKQNRTVRGTLRTSRRFPFCRL